MTDFDYAAWAAQPPDMTAALQAAVAEQKRREAAPLIEEAKELQLDELVEAGHVEVVDTPKIEDAPQETSERGEWLETIPKWSDPGTDHGRMYRRGALVRHNGRVWRSETAGLNVWEPGGDGVHYFIWRDVTDELAPTGAEAPSDTTDTDDDGDDGGGTTPVEDGTREAPFTFRAGLALTPGQHVTYSGDVYRVVQGHTTQDDWTPDKVPALFAKVN